MANSIELTANSSQNNIIYSNSRYNYHLIYRLPENGNKFLETFKITQIRSRPTDINYIVSQDRAFRPDLISYDFYDTPLLWWLFCIPNGIMNPLDKTEGLYTGRVITIPDISALSTSGT